MNINISLKNHINNLFGDLILNEEITEITINEFNKIFYEDKEGWKQGNDEQNARVTKQNCENFSNALASQANQKFDSSNPILGTTLPSDERVQIVRPPACDSNQFSITIRKPSKFSIDLDSFKKNGFFDDVEIDSNISTLDFKLLELLEKKDFMNFCKLAISSGKKNIAIAGATGSGKTTFMKSLIAEIPSNERLITIEDVRELFLINHYNFVNLLYPSEHNEKTKIRPDVALKSCLRMKPDRIILAEVRGGEAFDYINAISSGHGGSITSLHAGNYEEAIRRLTLMFLQNKTGSQLPYTTAESIIKETIDIIITIGKSNGKRAINSLHWKDYLNVKNAATCLKGKIDDVSQK